MKKITLFILTFSTLLANTLYLDGRFLPRGGVDLAIGDNPTSVFLNPASLNFLDTNGTFKFNFLNASIALNRDTINFLSDLNDALSKDSENQRTIASSNVMEKNIGNKLTFNTQNLFAIYQSKKEFNWLFGIFTKMEGYFITHSGFGSKGAMESLVDRYNGLILTLSKEYQNLNYGLNLKAIKKYQTIHNYSINEIVENDDITYYFDNKYTKNETSLGADIGLTYSFESDLNPKIGFSILNIGDINFKDVGEIKSTSNLGFSITPQINNKKLLFGVDFIDILNREDEFLNQVRVGVSSKFFSDKLTLNSGILNQNLSLGVDYKFSIVNLSFATFTTKEYDFKNKKYQLSLSILW